MSIDLVKEKQSSLNLNWNNRTNDVIENCSSSMMQKMQKSDINRSHTVSTELALDKKLNSTANNQENNYGDMVVSSSSSLKDQHIPELDYQMEAKDNQDEKYSLATPNKQQIVISEDEMKIKKPLTSSPMIRLEKQSICQLNPSTNTSLTNEYNDKQSTDVSTSKDCISLQQHEPAKAHLTQNLDDNSQRAKACTSSLQSFHQSYSEKFYDDSSDSTISSIADDEFSENQVYSKASKLQLNFHKDIKTHENSIKDQLCAVDGSRETPIVIIDQNTNQDEKIALHDTSCNKLASLDTTAKIIDKQSIPNETRIEEALSGAYMIASSSLII